MITMHIDEQRGWRGGEQQASDLVCGLMKRGHRCLLVGRPGSEWLQRHADADVETAALALRGEWDLASVWRLARRIRTAGVEVVHAHTGHAHTFAVLAAKLAGRGVVVAARRVDFAPSCNPLTRWKYRKARRIIAVSQCIARVLTAYGVPEDRIDVVYSAQDPARLAAQAVARADLDVPEGVPLFLCAAAFVGHKDHATLLRAFALLRQDLPEAVLLLAGTGPLERALRAQAERLGLGRAVRFLGYRRDIPGLMRTAGTFVISSKMEGLGSAVLEAMWLGTPVTATAGGGIPEMVRHEDTGLLAPVGDAAALAQQMARMAKEPVLAARCAENARKLVARRHSVDAMVEATLDVYARALGENRA